MAQKLTQLELLTLAFEGVEARQNTNEQIKQVIASMYQEELQLQQAQQNAQAEKTQEVKQQEVQTENK